MFLRVAYIRGKSYDKLIHERDSYKSLHKHLISLFNHKNVNHKGCKATDRIATKGKCV